ncbi:biotin/lipoyl-containing protein [Acetobacter conturbans]|uniref:Biotin carboxyl carrier protein of acetyl-CoA carboxylase n=1 Tax=Acetobacter conturbans TaxID=1737472 RepID=A0ABX0K3L4_9PROT|nr:acetyl-CoA carboxylase biotin carboxyl carrier protein subunit [Acetobacter conturbans]
MDITQIRRLTDLLSRTPIEELEIEEGGQKIRLTRRAGNSTAVPSSPSSTPPIPSGPTDAPPPAASPVAERIISSPAYGVFHLSPSPGTPPYVQVGDTVEPGQQIGLVEAMKVFNAVKATEAGRIENILVTDGEEVEAGSPLFRLS